MYYDQSFVLREDPVDNNGYYKPCSHTNIELVLLQPNLKSINRKYINYLGTKNHYIDKYNKFIKNKHLNLEVISDETVRSKFI